MKRESASYKGRVRGNMTQISTFPIKSPQQRIRLRSNMVDLIAPYFSDREHGNHILLKSNDPSIIAPSSCPARWGYLFTFRWRSLYMLMPSNQPPRFSIERPPVSFNQPECSHSETSLSADCQRRNHSSISAQIMLLDAKAKSLLFRNKN